MGCCKRIKCAEHSNSQFEVAPEYLYAGYMEIAATNIKIYSVDSVNLHSYMPRTLVVPDRHLIGYNSIISIMYLGNSYSSSTLISDTPG